MWPLCRMVILPQKLRNLKCNRGFKRNRSTEGFQKKPKAAPKKNSASSIKLYVWVTLTTKIMVCWDQIIIDHD